MKLNPFTCELPEWRFAVGLTLIILGVAFIQTNSYKKGVIYAKEMALEVLKEEIEKIETKNKTGE